MLYYYLSHAAGDDEDYVRRFHQDLSAEVRALADAEGEVGYLDGATRADAGPWLSAARDAVSSCRAFIALWSPKYFVSERCGREWSVFAERLIHYQQLTGAVAPALIPVIWTDLGPGRMPAGDTTPLPLIPHSPGGAGLQQLIRLRSWRAGYDRFVADLARRVVDTASDHVIPKAVPGQDTQSVPAAFTSPAAEGRPVQRVHFVVVAGTRDEMDDVRDDVRFYGAHRQDWTPYRPQSAQPIAERARSVAAERRLGTQVEDIERLGECIERAQRDNDIVVLLVDLWITRIAAHRSVLVQIDSSAEPAVAILVPASRGDAETVRHRGELRAQLSATFYRRAGQPDQIFRTEIDTASEFDETLIAVLEEAQNRIFRRGRVFRRPGARDVATRPILEGP